MSSISRSKGNQTIKFGQLIDYNMRNIFLQKAYIKCGAETSPIPFSEKWKLSASLDQLAKVSDSLFLSLLYIFLYIYFRQYVFIACQAEGYQNILKLGYLPLAFTSYEAFFKKKQKKVWD